MDACLNQSLKTIGMSMLLFTGIFFMKQCSSRTSVNALAAVGAGLDLTPRLRQTRDDLTALAPPSHIPDVSSLHLIADPHTACAEDAAVAVDMTS